MSCIFCVRSAQVTCQSCEENFCGKRHLLLHFNLDINQCYPFKVEESPYFGRYLVASRDIEAGEVIFRDTPVAVGPNHESSPICLTCNEQIDCSYSCPECCYPLCNENCRNSPDHQDLCRILSNEKNKEDVLKFDEGATAYAYHAIVPLKLLLLRESDPDKFSLLDRLMDHAEIRQKDSYWEESQEKIVERIRIKCGHPEFEEAEIHRMVGILETNAYEIQRKASCGFRGLFPLASLMSHDCRTNVCHQWSSNPPYTNTCIAAIDIKKGEQICSTYVSPEHCTVTRRRKLNECWYFDCTCLRCSDPTELGSMCSAIICLQCKSFDETNFMLAEDPLNYTSDFVCKVCNVRMSSDKVAALIKEFSDQFNNLIEDFKKNFNQLLQLLKKAFDVLHPHHEIICEISVWVIPLLCRFPGKHITQFPLSELQHKSYLCKNLLEVLDIITPGINRRRGKVLFEYAESEVGILSKCSEENSISSEYNEVRSRMKSISNLCTESIRCLTNIGELTKSEEAMLISAHSLLRNAQIFLNNF